MLLSQSRPDLADEARLVHVYQADASSPYAGFIDLKHPENIWINPEYVYNATQMRGELAHELTHHHDWRVGILTERTCGEDYFQAEYRAFEAQIGWQPWADTIWENYIRAQPAYQRPCTAT